MEIKCPLCGKYSKSKSLSVKICPDPNHKCALDAEELYDLLEELEVDEDIINNVRKSLNSKTASRTV
jgi:hypothetical protein